MRKTILMLIFIVCFALVACGDAIEYTNGVYAYTTGISSELRTLAQSTAIEIRENFYQFIDMVYEVQGILGENILTIDYYFVDTFGILLRAFEYPATHVDEQILEFSRS